MKAIQQERAQVHRTMPDALRALPWAGSQPRSADWWVTVITVASGLIALVGTVAGWL